MSESVSFARKYRPKTINEYLGEGIKDIVKKRFFETDNYPNIILLHGTHGCGKTSCARLLALEYLCQSKVDGHACGECEICQELLTKLINAEAGVENDTSVREIDIAAEGSKGNIDNIIMDATEEPVYFKYKILIMDEFHMANKAVQNRLLKVMEEPPKHLVFILCTTDPEAIIDTIHSRCQLKIEVKKAKINDLANRMKQICEAEKITTSMEALRLIAQKTQRIPRDAFMMLEQTALNHGNVVTVETVSAELSDVATDVYLEYFKCANKSLESVMQFVYKLKSDDNKDLNIRKFLNGLMQFVLDSVNIVYGIGIEEYPKNYVSAVSDLMKLYSNSDIDVLLQIIEQASLSIHESDEKIMLTIVTTAMRIGKLRYLEDLQHIEVEKAQDNRKAKRARTAVVKQDTREATKTSVEQLSIGVLSDMFDGELVEINNDNKPKAPVEEPDEDVVSDEELDSIMSDLFNA